MPRMESLQTERTWRGLTAPKNDGPRSLRKLTATNGHDREFQLAGKVSDAVSEEHGDGELVAIKLWSNKGWTCDLFFIEVVSGTVVAQARAETESEAWRICAEIANNRGYTV